MAEVDPSVVDYLKTHRLGVLAASKQRGGPQQTLIAYTFDGNDIAISTRAPSLKARLIEKEPDVSLAVVDGRLQLVVYGSTRIARDADEVFRLHKERINPAIGRPESDDDLRWRLEQEKRVVLLITPERFFPTKVDPSSGPPPTPQRPR